jgi:hypothetical protein
MDSRSTDTLPGSVESIYSTNSSMNAVSASPVVVPNKEEIPYTFMEFLLDRPWWQILLMIIGIVLFVVLVVGVPVYLLAYRKEGFVTVIPTFSDITAADAKNVADDEFPEIALYRVGFVEGFLRYRNELGEVIDTPKLVDAKVRAIQRVREELNNTDKAPAMQVRLAKFLKSATEKTISDVRPLTWAEYEIMKPVYREANPLIALYQLAWRTGYLKGVRDSGTQINGDSIEEAHLYLAKTIESTPALSFDALDVEKIIAEISLIEKKSDAEGENVKDSVAETINGAKSNSSKGVIISGSTKVEGLKAEEDVALDIAEANRIVKAANENITELEVYRNQIRREEQDKRRKMSVKGI